MSFPAKAYPFVCTYPVCVTVKEIELVETTEAMASLCNRETWDPKSAEFRQLSRCLVTAVVAPRSLGSFLTAVGASLRFEVLCGWREGRRRSSSWKRAMPLVRLEVRNEFRLGDAKLYEGGKSGKDDSKAILDGVAVAGLVGILRQLGDLTE
ncbi:hypothetical protein BHE74_00038693 [Ensete ventricosum]|nr:hypothetical protein BHE74_00038693 [Ensete ventricosum]